MFIQRKQALLVPRDHHINKSSKYNYTAILRHCSGTSTGVFLAISASKEHADLCIKTVFFLI